MGMRIVEIRGESLQTKDVEKEEYEVEVRRVEALYRSRIDSLP